MRCYINVTCSKDTPFAAQRKSPLCTVARRAVGDSIKRDNLSQLTINDWCSVPVFVIDIVIPQNGLWQPGSAIPGGTGKGS
jgi:hypothetical protein